MSTSEEYLKEAQERIKRINKCILAFNKLRDGWLSLKVVKIDNRSN